MIKKFWKNPMVWIVGIVVLVLAFVVWPDGSGEYDDFAKCLADSRAVMYGTDWCGHCNNQKEMFGKSFEFVNFVNCDFQREECLIAGVESYPTWNIAGENYVGVQSLERLGELSGCGWIGS